MANFEIEKGDTGTRKMITWVFPEKIEVKIRKEGEYFIYDYREKVPLLPKAKYGKDDTQRLFDEKLIKVLECECLKFEANEKGCHIILKTKNPLKLITHFINEVNILGRKPLTEEDVYG